MIPTKIKIGYECYCKFFLIIMCHQHFLLNYFLTLLLIDMLKSVLKLANKSILKSVLKLNNYLLLKLANNLVLKCLCLGLFP